MEDIVKKVIDDELNIDKNNIGKSPTKYIKVPNKDDIKDNKVNKNKKNYKIFLL